MQIISGGAGSQVNQIWQWNKGMDIPYKSWGTGLGLLMSGTVSRQVLFHSPLTLEGRGRVVDSNTPSGETLIIIFTKGAQRKVGHLHTEEYRLLTRDNILGYMIQKILS